MIKDQVTARNQMLLYFKQLELKVIQWYEFPAE